MAITGVVTNQGLAEAVKASSHQGWSIFPTRFGVSALIGELRPTRTTANTTWYDARITDQTVVSENTIQFVCTIPPQVVEIDQHIKEIYLFGENSTDKTEFLLAVGHPSEVITYFKDGSITLRMHVTLANIQASNIFEFKYAGHRSIEDHNTDDNAHQTLFGTLTDQIQALGETILIDGQLASGGSLYIDRDSGHCRVDSAKFYHQGVLYSVDEGELSVPLNGVTGIGIWINQALEEEEKQLIWGTRFNPRGQSYHEIHVVENGYLKTVVNGEIVREPVATAIVRYDRDANGSYIVHGLQANIKESGDNHYIVQVSDGKAHIDGVEIEQQRIVELKQEYDPDTVAITAEPHIFSPDEKGIMGISVFEQPLAAEYDIEVIYKKRQTLGIQRGQARGTKDLIVENLTKVHEISYGATVYHEGRDYRVIDSYIDWSPSGVEPPTGTLFTADVEYLRKETISQTKVSQAGFDFEGAIPHSQLLVSYHTMLPRKDALVITRTGHIERIKGRGDIRSLTSPKIPQGALKVADITQHWIPGVDPIIADSGVVAVQAQELNEMRRNIADLYDMVAVERVSRLANADDPRVTQGIFVDAFINDDQRDAGATQTAMVDTESQELTLAFDVHTIDTKTLSAEDAPQGISCLPYTLREAVSQNASTGSMKVNPYAAFEPIPASLTLTPSLDNWTIKTNLRTSISRSVITARQRLRASDFVRRFGSGSTANVTTGRTVTSRTSMRLEELPHLRSLRVSFDVKGFKPGEKIRNIYFGSVNVTNTVKEANLPVVDKVLQIGDNALLDTRPLFEGAQKSLTHWERSNPSPTGQLENERTAWSIGNGNIQYRLNSNSWAMLLSTGTFDNFDVTVRFTCPWGDNDRVGIVLARLNISGEEHTLSAIRNQDKGENDMRWAIVKDYRTPHSTDIHREKNDQVQNNNGANWSQFPQGVLIRVRRSGNIIECWTGEAGANQLSESSKYLINLETDDRLSVFRRPCSWGFGSFSQSHQVEVISHTNHGNLG
ncbi:hypothetical protein CWB96_00405 [Pseudoalteromonas citrea]|uniref:DUF4815 domain-containing protein n=1 Tax=Pseudoalteromonas citrea TaxID=43655 RepID=A0A5S3XVJ6_9GAMM|nr:DUF4815 domain-containing protein [Pseudoalteromonas citrea]TMP46328.1 hypothetical protein CWB97_02400 [Pseudoalteromonas citrea]TMP63104.1 hypothetical protein CWB96_00405 [Pseudoalteromonas citrea]